MSKILKGIRMNKDDYFQIDIVRSRANNEDKYKDKIDTNEKMTKKENSDRLIEESYKKSNNILNDAKKEAESILSEANKLAEEIKEKAYAEGEKEGKVEGEKKIKELYLEEIKEIKSIKNSINEEKRKILQSAENDIIDFSLSIVNRILPSITSKNKDMIIDLITNCIEKFKKDENVIIRVSPDNYDVAINNKAELQKKISGTTDITILKDLSLEKSDCIIEGETGNVKTNSKKQYEIIKKHILGEVNE